MNTAGSLAAYALVALLGPDAAAPQGAPHRPQSPLNPQGPQGPQGLADMRRQAAALVAAER